MTMLANALWLCCVAISMTMLGRPTVLPLRNSAETATSCRANLHSPRAQSALLDSLPRARQPPWSCQI